MKGKPTATMTEYAKRFSEEDSLKGAISRRILAIQKENRDVETLPGLIIWLGPTEYPIANIESYSLGEQDLRNYWCEYCAACDHSL